MRPLTLTSLLAATLALAPHAFADTFSFTPTGGTAIDFTTGSTPDGSNTASPYDYAQYNVGNATVYFFGSDQSMTFQNGGFVGPNGTTYGDFDLRIDINGTEYLEDGQQLFTGSVSDPSFLTGTYALTGDAAEGNGTGGVLLINGGAPVSSVTPEPSSLLLLGTGALGLVGTLRRRFQNA